MKLPSKRSTRYAGIKEGPFLPLINVLAVGQISVRDEIRPPRLSSSAPLCPALFGNLFSAEARRQESRPPRMMGISLVDVDTRGRD